MTSIFILSQPVIEVFSCCQPHFDSFSEFCILASLTLYYAKYKYILSSTYILLVVLAYALNYIRKKFSLIFWVNAGRYIINDNNVIPHSLLFEVLKIWKISINDPYAVFIDAYLNLSFQNKLEYMRSRWNLQICFVKRGIHSCIHPIFMINNDLLYWKKAKLIALSCI